MANFYTDNGDLQYYVERGIDWAPLVELSEYHFRTPDGFRSADEALEVYRDVLELLGSYAGEQIAPYSAQIDRQKMKLVDGEVVFGPRLAQIFEGLRRLEVYGMSLPRELGGQNIPLLVQMLAGETIARADVSVMTHIMFHGGIAAAMLVYSAREGTTTLDAESGRITTTRFAEAIDEIRRGQAWGSMDITEPNAGSDMAAIRTVARQDDEGVWRLTGQKIFISSGHGKYHFVIARTEAASNSDDPLAGLEGLSMFLVPAYEEGPDGSRQRLVTIDRLEEKLGHHSSATCSVSFDDTPAQLVGKRGEGFQYMLVLMNNARVGVGFEGIGLCEAAYRLARDYAAGRESMGKTIDRHEMIADYLDEMETDLFGIRALAVTAAYSEEMARKLDLLRQLALRPGSPEDRREEERYRHHAAVARRLTPLLKYVVAEKAVDMARRCLQIHGGVGYTTEYGAEKLVRDAMVVPIYEGTSQIQALMAMKDALGAFFKNPQGFLRRLAQARWRSLSARDSLERRVAKLQLISLSAQQVLIRRTAINKVRELQGEPITQWPRRLLRNWNPKRDFAWALLHAERLIRILVDEAIAELLLEQAARHPDRRILLERHLERSEPRCRMLYDEIVTTGQRLLDQLASRDEAAAEAA